MARLTTEQKELRDLIKRLTEHIKTDRDAERATAKAERATAEAAKSTLPTWQVRYVTKYRQLRTQLRNAQQTLADSESNSYQLMQARMFIELNTSKFAALILDRRELLANEAGHSLIDWATFHRQYDRREPAPLPLLNPQESPP
jgi:hypothetical protein